MSASNAVANINPGEFDEMENDLSRGLKEALATGDVRNERRSGADFTKDAVRASAEKSIRVIEQRRDERVDAMRAALRIEVQHLNDEIALLNQQRADALAMAEKLGEQASVTRQHAVKLSDDGAAAIKEELETFNSLINAQRDLLTKL